MVRITEDRPLIPLEIFLESPQEFETGETSPFAVEVLAHMGDPAFFVDPVMGELKGDPLVGSHAPIEGNGHLGSLEIDEVKWVDPLRHLGIQTLAVEIRVRITGAGLLHLQAGATLSPVRIFRSRS